MPPFGSGASHKYFLPRVGDHHGNLEIATSKNLLGDLILGGQDFQVFDIRLAPISKLIVGQ